ncbi:MAG TPA: hypothetical protein VH087_11680 [Thermoanaerobaculia bacterium]|nr:hypothetical protein [Thermoanaerobaculia bacterium]
MRRCIFVTLLFLAVTAQAAEQVKIGAYVMRLNDLNPSTASFSTDVWIWTLSSAASPLHPIQTLRLANTKSVSADVPGEADNNGTRWGYREFAAVMNNDWDTREFPFDHHTLKIRVDETISDTDALRYVPDANGSHIDPRVQIPGWRITRLRLETHTVEYPTRFGDPDPRKATSHWSEAWLLIDVRRNGLGIFFKVIMVAYIAFALVMLSFLMDAPVFSSRISMLVGCLFATVVNMRASESVIGRTDSFTLIDQIHLLVAFFIFVSAVVALVTRRGEAARAQRIDRWAATISLVVFVAANALLIARAFAN